MSDLLAYCTTRIECRLKCGSVSTGTAFFHILASDGTSQVPALVTNKHVVSDAVTGQFRITKASSEGRPLHRQHQIFTLDNFENRWIPHPDPNIDLCILPIATLLREANLASKDLYYAPLENSLIPSQKEFEDLLQMEEITMIGYPNGIWDQVNNMPIFRRGITATHPALDWNGKPEFLIDAACFPGSSGSPVFLFNQTSFSTRNGGTVVSGGRVKLLGILYAGPQHTVTGEIKIVTIPTRNVPLSVSTIPNNLGMVIRSSKLDFFQDMFTKYLANAKNAFNLPPTNQPQ
jgi:hypothetical protein